LFPDAKILYLETCPPKMEFCYQKGNLDVVLKKLSDKKWKIHLDGKIFENKQNLSIGKDNYLVIS